MEQVSRHAGLSRVLSIFFIGLVLFLAVSGGEVGFLLIFNPNHWLGEGNITSHLLALLFLLIHTILFALIFVSELVAAFLIARLIARPLALFAYLASVRKAQKRQHKLYFPLTFVSNITLDAPHQTTANTSIRNKQRKVALLDLIEQQNSHQLFLGVPGAGKTMALSVYQYAISQRRWAIVRGRMQMPVYIPLKNYSLFLESRQQDVNVLLDEEAREGTLFEFLYESKQAMSLPGIHHLRPYLKELMDEGHLLFLCDGLNEVHSDYLQRVCSELSWLMSETDNRLVMTCREVDYHEQPQLMLLVDKYVEARAVINPLGLDEIEVFVEAYKKRAGKKLVVTKEEVMEKIKTTRLSDHCTNPMMLVTLIEIIDSVDRRKDIDTRGLLLREFVSQLIGREKKKPRWFKETLSEDDVRRFLSEIACAARWTKDRRAIQLGVSIAEERLGRKERLQELARGLRSWLDTNSAKGPLVTDDEAERLAHSILEEEKYDLETLAKLLEFARNAELVTIDAAGVLTFRHELIAEYFVGEYFYEADKRKRYQLPIRQELLEDVKRWSEPVALWAGLLDNPMELANRFATLVDNNFEYVLEALTLSLACIGVMWTPHQAEIQRTVVLPPSVESALKHAVRNGEARNNLARIFTRCAEEGGQEVYQSLLPLLTVEGIDQLLVKLDEAVVPGLLFKHLQQIVDEVADEPLARVLMRVLGQFGKVVVAHATELTHPDQTRRMRSAAITILGGTHEPGAVEPLIECLSDQDKEIVLRAENALVRIGPESSLASLIQILENRTPTPDAQRIYGAALNVIGRFLNEQKVAANLTDLYHQRMLEVVLALLTSSYAFAPSVQQQAQEILVRQGRTAEEHKRGKKVVVWLIERLSSGDEMLVRNAMYVLEESRTAATTSLLEHLPKQPLNIVRQRIVKVLEKVHDPRALDDLLSLVADASPLVQQQVASALCAYAPQSIPRLIDIVLADPNEEKSIKSALVLEKIGSEEVVKQVKLKLSPIVPGRTLRLVNVLDHLHNSQAMPELIALLETPDIEEEAPLAKAIVHALGHFHDERVVPPLHKMLASSHAEIHEEASEALSRLGDLPVHELVAELDVQQETEMASRVRRVLLHGQFQGEKLVNELAAASDVQALQIMEVLRSKGEDGARAMVPHLLDKNDRVRGYMHQTLDKMKGYEVVAVLLEGLNHVESEWRTVIAGFLLKHPKEAIPRLISLLSDDKRGDVAEAILLQFGPDILPSLVPALDDPDKTARDRSKRIIVTLVQQVPETISRVVKLFALSLPPRAHETVLNLLTNDLVSVSPDALLKGLENVEIVKSASEALKRLVRKHDAQSSALLKSLLKSLYSEQRMHGVETALITIGADAVYDLDEMITDPAPLVAQSAQRILRDIGAPAFPAIWASYSNKHNKPRSEAALSVFRGMSTNAIKQDLVTHLMSDDPGEIAMALSLLSIRIYDEARWQFTNQSIIPALLEFAQSSSDNLRIIALLLMLGGNTVTKRSITNHVLYALFNHPENHQAHLVQALLLLGKEAEEPLLSVLNSTNSPKLRAELVSVLGMISPSHPKVLEHVERLASINISARQTGPLIHDQMAINLRALGGLLASGQGDVSKLRELQDNSKFGGAEYEFYDVLLGHRNGPTLTKLQDDLNSAREAYQRIEQELKQSKLDQSIRAEQVKKLTQENANLSQGNVSLRQKNAALEQENEGLNQEKAALNRRILWESQRRTQNLRGF